jgi:hypothetical protein
MNRGHPIALKAVAGLSMAALVATIGASAQELNPRKSAAPQGSAKVSRVVAAAELQSERDDDNSLRKEELSVTHECGTVSVGGTPASKEASKPQTLRGSNLATNKENVVSAKNIVNICR